MSDAIELPSGWQLAKVSEVADNRSEKVEPLDRPNAIYIGMEHVAPGTMQLAGEAHGRDYKSSANSFRKGDVLYGRLRPYLNKVLLPEFSGLCSGELIVLESSPELRPAFLARVLNSQTFVSFAGTLDTGDRPRVRFQQIGNYRFPLPPLSEQDRILAVLELEEKLLLAGRADLVSAADSLDLLRIAVLAELGASDAPLKKVEEIGEVFVGATPKRSQPEFWDGGTIPWVSSSEVAFCRIGGTKEAITEAGLGKRETRLQPPGSVLLAMYGEGKTRGQAAILDIEAATNQAVAAVRCDPEKMLPAFLYYCFMRQYDAVRKFSRGGQQPNLNKGIVQAIEIPCPPLDVQRQLVEYVSGALSVADQYEADLSEMTCLAQASREALLHAALTGQLGTQDPDDKPVELPETDAVAA